MGHDKKDEVLEAAKSEITEVNRHWTLIYALVNKAMQEKHWVKVWALVNGPPGKLLNFNLNQLFEHGIDAHAEKVEEYLAYAGSFQF